MGKFIIDLSSVTTVGLDLAKHIFQVHGVDAYGRVIVANSSVARTYRPSSPNCPVSCRYRSLRFGPSLGPRADQAWP
jgi:hypothetical protein